MWKKITTLAFAVTALSLTACSTTSAKKSVQTVEADPLMTKKVKLSVPLDASPVYFDFDQSELDGESLEKLGNIARHMRKNKHVNVTIEGHCDERGTSEYNLALGEKRARAARDYLVALGVNEKRVRVLSFGEELPAVDGATDEAHAKNRRDEFTFYKLDGANALLSEVDDQSIHVRMSWDG